MVFKIKCSCGDSFEVDGSQSKAECPNCGDIKTASQMIKYGRLEYRFGQE